MKYLSFIMLVCLWSIVDGQSLTLSDARKQADQFYQNQLKSFPEREEEPIVIIKQHETEVLYGFNYKGGGYVLVSAFETGNNIIAYAPSGNIDVQNMPPSFEFWLNMIGEYLYDTYVITGKLSVNQIATKEQTVKSTSSVNPLCSTLWDQGCYYNEFCPADAFGPCNHCVTGCVATAMAQIMKYWNYPATGQGSHTYIHPIYGTLSADFGSTVYQWGLMSDSLSGSEAAVATLMSHCGIAVDMGYSSTSSGSYISPLPFIQYFKYSLNASLKSNDSYDVSSWIQLLKNELDEGRPILYSGMPAPPLPVGHAWVCDGYDSNDYFHFNWGWSGNSNGYFQMGNFIYYLSNQVVAGLMPVQNNDIKVKALQNPVSSSYTGAEPIRIILSNYDTVPHWNIPLTYSIDNGPLINDILTDTIPPLSDFTFEFSQPWNFAGQPGHIYQVKIYSSLPGDTYKDNDTLLMAVEDVICSYPLYQMGFEPGEPVTGWKIENLNHDDYTWYYGSLGGYSGPHCIYMISGGQQQGDDWLISKCISLESGKLYRLSFWNISGGGSAGQDFRVYMGNSDDIGDLNILLGDMSNTPDNNFHQVQAWFTVPVTGSYYFGWHYKGLPGSTCPVLDDIMVKELSETDAGIHHIISPSDGCDLQQQPVMISIMNYCSSTLQNIPVGYRINGGNIVTDTVPGPILPGETIDFTFDVPADLSAAGNYSMKVFLSLSSDTLNDNDTLSFSVYNHHSPAYPYSMGFESNEDFSEWTIENTNGDNYTWTCQSSGGHNGPFCMRYDYSSWIAADDWIFTKCLYMIAGNTYKLSFYEKIEDPAWPENLSISIGTAPVSTAMNEPILDLPGLLNVTWQHQQLYFTVIETGYYYLGWKCYSDPLMFNVYLDDIYLEEYPSGISNITDNTGINIYPNPGEGEYIIDCSGISDEKFYLEVVTMAGERVYSDRKVKTESFVLNLSQLNPGIYFLKIVSQHGTVVKKLIKK